MTTKYDNHSRDQLLELLKKRDRKKQLGLVWERNEIEADNALDADFVVATPVAELAERPAPWHNIVLEGDNYNALRWLRMTMSGRIKCIYVDPPYNTGNKDWVYNDHYMNVEDRLRHSTWLEYLFQRFSLARDLLTEDGVILISINDEQRSKLELLVEEAMPGMRIGSFTWRTRTGGNEGGDNFFTDNHEHVLVFGKPGFRFAGTEKSYEDYANPDGDSRGDWQADNLTQSKTATERFNSYFPLIDPETGIHYPCNPDSVWRYVSSAITPKGKRVRTKFMEEWIAERQIVFPKEQRVETWANREALVAAIEANDVPLSNRSPLLRLDLPDIRLNREDSIPALEYWVGRPVGFGTPRFKRFKKDLKNATQPLSSWIAPKTEKIIAQDDVTVIAAGTNDEGAKVIKAVFGTKKFNYAKPVSLIRELVRQCSSPGDKILDFFAGSATTAHAVMELNVEDDGDRTFIMVSSTEATEKESEKNLCRDITAERIRLINSSESAKFADLGAGFCYLRCETVDFDDLDHDLTPQQIWAALEAMHGLPLTAYVGGLWQEHKTDSQTIVYADRVTAELIKYVSEIADRRENAFIYVWAPGQIRQALGTLDIEIRSVRDTLVSRFRQ